MDQEFPINRLPASLITSVRKHKCIPFVGAGVSIPLGLPAWAKLLDELAKEVKQQEQNYFLVLGLKQKGCFLQAFQAAKEELGAARYRSCLQKMFSQKVDKGKLEIQRLIWSLKPPMVITTNIDTLLEDAIQPPPEVITPENKAALADLFKWREDEQKLFKLHGSIDRFETVCLTLDDYEKLYSDQAYSLTHKTSILQNTILFLGFSLTDSYVMEQFEWIAKAFSGFGGPHFALLEKVESVKAEEVWRKYNIQKVPYTTHDLLPKILQELVNVVGEKNLSSISERICEEKPRIIRLTPSESVPKGIRERSIGECIILYGPKKGEDKLLGWADEQIGFNIDPVFFEPRTRDIFDVKHKAMIMDFEKKYWPDSPKCWLRRFTIRRARIACNLELTSWTMIHAIQSELGKEEEITKRFWDSVVSLISAHESKGFPHHIGNHCLLISKDNKVILNIRASVDNQRGRVSASFEEQTQAPYIAQERGNIEEYRNGDRSPFDAMQRGAREELNIQIEKKQTRILAFALEASSIAANFLGITKSNLTAQEIYEHWQSAECKEENSMIRPNFLPSWDIQALLPLLSTEEPSFGKEGDIIYKGRWHASSRARILLGLLYDFGYQQVSKYIKFKISL